MAVYFNGHMAVGARFRQIELLPLQFFSCADWKDAQRLPLGADALTAITTLGFTFMALDCFDALLNWTNEHSYVKAIVTGSSDGTFTDEQLAATVIQRYFESNPDLLPTAQGRRFFTFVGFQERAIVKFSIQRNLVDLATIFTPLRIFCDRDGAPNPKCIAQISAPIARRSWQVAPFIYGPA